MAEKKGVVVGFGFVEVVRFGAAAVVDVAPAAAVVVVVVAPAAAAVVVAPAAAAVVVVVVAAVAQVVLVGSPQDRTVKVVADLVGYLVVTVAQSVVMVVVVVVAVDGESEPCFAAAANRTK